MTSYTYGATTIELRRVYWLVPSFTSDKTYRVEADPATRQPCGCSCPAFNRGRYQGKACRHMNLAESGAIRLHFRVRVRPSMTK